VLLDLARAKPQRSAEIRKRLQHGPARFASEWLAAIMRGKADGVLQRLRSAAPPAISRHEGALRQKLDDAIGRWRRAEARRRGVDMQVIMPGHCVSDAVAALARCSERDDMLSALRGVEGMGDKRIAQYAGVLQDMALAIIAHRGAPAALPDGG
jgi:ribonuclease D